MATCWPWSTSSTPSTSATGGWSASASSTPPTTKHVTDVVADKTKTSDLKIRNLGNGRFEVTDRHGKHSGHRGRADHRHRLPRRPPRSHLRVARHERGCTTRERPGCRPTSRHPASKVILTPWPRPMLFLNRTLMHPEVSTERGALGCLELGFAQATIAHADCASRSSWPAISVIAVARNEEARDAGGDGRSTGRSRGSSAPPLKGVPLLSQERRRHTRRSSSLSGPTREHPSGLSIAWIHADLGRCTDADRAEEHTPIQATNSQISPLWFANRSALVIARPTPANARTRRKRRSSRNIRNQRVGGMQLMRSIQ